MARVFFIEPTRRNCDLSTARAFGRIEYLFQPEDRRPSSFYVEAYTQAVVDQLTALQFDPQRDCIAIAGSLVAMAVSLAAIFSRWPTINVLMYSAVESRYMKRTLSITGDKPDVKRIPKKVSRNTRAAS